jgi:prephenate dehydratase
MQVILAGESTNSYDLMRASDLVVVANSTVGVEACLLGKRVVCTNSTYYDLIADVIRYHGEGDDLKVLTGKTPKISSAQIWVAGMKSLVVRIDDSARLAFESVDQSRSIFAIALGFVTSLQGYTVFIEVKKKLRRLVILLLLEKLSHRALH